VSRLLRPPVRAGLILLTTIALLWALAGCVPVPLPAPTPATVGAGVGAAETAATAAARVPLEDGLANLQPRDVWQNFYDVTQIPRPSGQPEGMRAFLVAFGQRLGLETSVDGVGNVLIRKPASPGMEARQGVILQTHMDMVPQKAPGVTHDFAKDPIQAYVEGGWVKADGTTLGADDGIGMAIVLALLQSKDLTAGPIEALFTVDEETTMAGADGLQPGLLQGRVYINIDGDMDGVFTIGSAGGAMARVTTPYPEVAVQAGMAAYQLSVQGLRGGHSGVDINLGRGHAGKLLVRFLRSAAGTYGLRVAGIASGTVGNAIPREASALVVVPQAQADVFVQGAGAYQEIIKDELAATEPNLSVQVTPAEVPAQVMEEAAQSRLIDALYASPQGVLRMSDAAPGLVETSTNLGILKAQAGTLEASYYMRSSVDTSLDDVAGMIGSAWELAGSRVTVSGRYLGWAPNAASPILALMQEVYTEKYGQPAQVTAVHAGLECGTIVAKQPGLDAISVGPTVRDAHSPDEALNVAGVAKLTDFLKEVLRRIPES
jgi:dipeptidase D